MNSDVLQQIINDLFKVFYELSDIRIYLELGMVVYTYDLSPDEAGVGGL